MSQDKARETLKMLVAALKREGLADYTSQVRDAVYAAEDIFESQPKSTVCVGDSFDGDGGRWIVTAIDHTSGRVVTGFDRGDSQ